MARLRKRARRKVFISDDQFSKDLAQQGELGRTMRMLYLRNEMDTYIRKVNDESIQH